MKYFTFILFFTFSLQLVYSQEATDLKQFSLGITGVGATDIVGHRISAVGTVWEEIGSVFEVSEDQGIDNSIAFSVGNADFNQSGWEAFFNWKWVASGADPIMGLGFYKVTVTLSTASDKYYYFDARDSDWGSNSGGFNNPDIYSYFDNLLGTHNVFDWPLDPNEVIIPIDGEIVKVGDIYNLQQNTSGLTSFWSNALLIIEGGEPYARLAWGPHPTFNATNYKIYRAVATVPTNPRFLNFDLIRITNSTTYEYTDIEFVIGGSTTYSAWYYVKAYNSNTNDSSLASNTVNTFGEYTPFKIAFENPEETQASRFSLNQNYPNPFNPTTTIQFSIKNNTFATLKIYDILGKQVAVLLNDLVEAGDHTVEFDAADLPSGIYMYQLQADGIILTKKMILLR